MGDVLPSDVAFDMFLATVTVADLNEYELALFRAARFEKLKAS